jgi:hypothetical protein
MQKNPWGKNIIQTGKHKIRARFEGDLWRLAEISPRELDKSLT